MKIFKNEIKIKVHIAVLLLRTLLANILSCSPKTDKLRGVSPIAISDETSITVSNLDSIGDGELLSEAITGDNDEIEDGSDTESETFDTATQELSDIYTTKKIYVDFTAPYATYSIINDGYAVLYKVDRGKVANYKNKTVAVNAGHGTKGGANVKTFSHPDFSPKYTGGSTAAGSVLSAAVSAGMTFENGMTEANANLVIAYALKDKLLADGYSVLMIREDDDCRLDNIARTVIANENADAHIAIHFDSTNTDKGIFYIVPYNDARYLNMEPLKSNVQNIKKLGDSVISAFREMGEKIWKDKGTLQGDLTQLSFSTNASIDIELGDRKTVLTMEKAETFAEGIKRGVDKYFGFESVN